MFIRLVHHWPKLGQAEAGRRYTDEFGERMATAPGFMYRQRLEPPAGPSVITTLTAWDSQESFERWRAVRTSLSHLPDYPFERTEDQKFVVQSSTGATPA